jgi:unsaturated rhamnogalacturonyl hydrolase
MTNRRVIPAIAAIAALLSTAALTGLAAAAAAGCGAGDAPGPAAGTLPPAVGLADAFIERHPGAVTYDSLSPSTKWNYEQGLMLHALLALGDETGDRRYFDFVRANIDRYIGADGAIGTYDAADYNLDNIAPGRVLLSLHAATGEPRYRKAADLLREQLRDQPRTKEGGFWHKKIYPFQMWLDGLYMAGPFYARHALLTGDTSALGDAAAQFVIMAARARDSATGLFRHGYDESRQERWADPATGRSPSFWSRSMGWYLMGLADVLEILPAEHRRRGELMAIFRSLAEAVARARDPRTGLWTQVTDRPGEEGNYVETSASAMFVYALAKGARLGYIDAGCRAAARAAFDSLAARAIVTGPSGLTDLVGTCRSAGLGGKPYRDGSYGYYIGEPLRVNDMKGLGSFILAAIEAGRADAATPGGGTTKGDQ